MYRFLNNSAVLFSLQACKKTSISPSSHPAPGIVDRCGEIRKPVYFFLLETQNKKEKKEIKREEKIRKGIKLKVKACIFNRIFFSLQKGNI